MKQGDIGTEFFCILSGSVSVIVDGVKVASLSEGSYFGERVILRPVPRIATIKTETKVSALSLTRDQFFRLDLHTKFVFPRRGAIVAGQDESLHAKVGTEKTDEDEQVIAAGIKS